MVDPATAIVQSVNSLCGVLSCSSAAGGVNALGPYIYRVFAMGLKGGFVAAATIMVFLNAFNMVLFSNEEGQVSEARKGFYHILAAGAVVSFGSLILSAFGIGGTATSGGNVNASPLIIAFNNVFLFISGIIGIAFLANLTLQAFRLVNSQGEQEYIERARKRIVTSIIGIGVVMLANVIVRVANGGPTTLIATEVAGITGFFLTMIGFLAVLSLVVAGIMLVISVNEGLKDKAKTAIRVALVTLVVVAMSFALVSSFASI